jgi:hypothetical protein
MHWTHWSTDIPVIVTIRSLVGDKNILSSLDDNRIDDTPDFSSIYLMLAPDLPIIIRQQDAGTNNRTVKSNPPTTNDAVADVVDGGVVVTVAMTTPAHSQSLITPVPNKFRIRPIHIQSHLIIIFLIKVSTASDSVCSKSCSSVDDMIKCNLDMYLVAMGLPHFSNFVFLYGTD